MSIKQIQSENQQHKYPGIWNKAMYFFTDNYFPFEKQYLAYYQALVDTKYLTMGCKMTMQSEIPILYQVLFEPQNLKSNINNNITHKIKIVSKHLHQLQEQGAQIHTVSVSTALPSFPHPYL